MNFIKINSNHWHPSQFEMSQEMERGISFAVAHITQTITLVESRADEYTEYLKSVFHLKSASWHEALERWNFEENQHGVILRKLCESTVKNYDFNKVMQDYTTNVAYHEKNGVSVRGSVAAELVSRCSVEVLASTLYQVLADSTQNTSYKEVFRLLSQDEARHYGMFKAMLISEGDLSAAKKITIIAKRLFELKDEQIIYPSFLARKAHNVPYRRSIESSFYIIQLYKLYKWKHVKYTARMLCNLFGFKTRGITHHIISILLFVTFKTNFVLAKIVLWHDSKLA